MSILQSLASYYERLAANGAAPAYGYSHERISYAVVLAAHGGVVDIAPLQDPAGDRRRAALLAVPQPVKRTSGVASNFLWDKTAYALGVTRDDSGRPVLARRSEHLAFMKFHQHLLAATDDAGLRALLLFLKAWRPDAFIEQPHAGVIAGVNVAFRLEGERTFIHERPAAHTAWLHHLAAKDSLWGQCLITGERAPIARLHASIKGVGGAQLSGAALVSFNLEAATSFGRDRGANGPVSERAAFAYTSALNALLAPDSKRSLRIGDATVVFWAETAGNEREARAAEEVFLLLAGHPPTAAEETAAVAARLRMLQAGRPLQEVREEVRDHTRFHVLALAPNTSRLAVRCWHRGTIGEIGRRIREHWSDLRLEPPPVPAPPAAWRLLYETAAQRNPKNIPPALGGALLRAILTGDRYPQSLLAAVVTRLRADGTVSALRAALLKACLRRAERLSNPNTTEDCLVSLDRTSDDVAYNLGRLFAVYVYAEKSYTTRAAAARDMRLGAAAASPRRVFPVLIRGHEYNRVSLARGNYRQRAFGMRSERMVGEILDRLPGQGEWPSFLPLDNQARFFVGYYHQERALYTRSGAERERAGDSGGQRWT